MMKFLLLAAVVGLVLWFTLRRNNGSARGGKAAAAPKPMAMVCCAHCGTYLPDQDAVRDGELLYCSNAHRLLGPRAL